MKADKIYLGNVITMDDKKPYAEAIAVKDGLIQYVGSENIARGLSGENTEIINLEGNTIYPGFLEAHCHPLGAGKMLDTESMVNLSAGKSLDEYIDILGKFVNDHPDTKMYSGQGFMERDVKPTAAMIDKVCADKPVMIDSGTTYAFHTDFPVSKIVDVPMSVYTAIKRRYTYGGSAAVRNADEFITRYQALLGLTRNVAYMWREENRLGSLEPGKLANMTVYTKDFLNDDIEEVAKAELVCTIVDGDIM